MNQGLRVICLFFTAANALRAEKPLTDFVNPFLGTAPLTNVSDIGFEPPWRVWAGLTYPGATLPNAMVQLSPITQFGSGAGYEYEDTVIHAFAHTNKGHWNLCHLPMLPVAGRVNPDDFGSPFSHARESARPGFYQVQLDRYGINAELTTTLRCGFHRYTYRPGADKKLVVNLAVSNEKVHNWRIERDGDNAIRGFQHAREKVYFYATSNLPIENIRFLKSRDNELPVVSFAGEGNGLELRVGVSFVSAANARKNLEAELGGKNFDQVRTEASEAWEAMLGKIRVAGGTGRQRGLFYSSLYRSMQWPVLRSDVNGEFVDMRGRVASKGFRYYATPALWDDYRNKLVLLAMLSPDVTTDVIQSLVDRGNCKGFMPTYFHGDHASVFITGSYLRGLRGFDVEGAYRLMLRNATEESKDGRPYLSEYLSKGYVSEMAVERPRVESRAKAAVTKTLEYAYNDYAVGLLARELNDEATHATMMKRASNFANLFDSATGLMRGRLANGDWVTPFDPEQPYYEYMYREANAWQSSFFAPHDTEGLISLYPSKDAFEGQLDRLFSLPWNPRHIAMNINSFIGQYCHGNQPDHGFPYLYYWVGKPEKSQAILNQIMDRFYGMDSGLTLCGMDDAGEMSAWYVFNAIGLYPYSPADPEYLITVPLFDEVNLNLNGQTVTIERPTDGLKISEITYDGQRMSGYSISHRELSAGKTLVIRATTTTNPEVTALPGGAAGNQGL